MAAIPADFDFESYINNYQGFTRITRALFIAKQCEPLAVEAYKFAIAEIKSTTLNTSKYMATVDALNTVLRRQGKAVFPPDQDWVMNTTQSNKTILDNLENDLKSAKVNVFKEEIRLAHIKLGEYYYKKGDIPSAIKNYIRTRDYCTQSEHIIEMCFDNIKVYLDEGNHSPVIQTYIARAETTANMPDKVNTTSKLKCCRALAFLGGSDANRYRNVANTLTEVVFDSNPFFNDIMSSNDVAIYGGLCGLVSYDRRQLQSNILNNANFKNFLSLEPGLYELVEAFYHSKYATCLELLEKYKNSMSLDVHLQPHILTLVQLVREKAIVQYCIPYSTIDMKKMAVSFNMTVDHLEEDLVVLIGKKEKISARIDSHEKILRTKNQEKRNEAFERSLVTGDNFEKSSKALLLRLNLLKAKMVVS